MYVGNSAHGSSATAPAERQLRRTISELNTTMDSAAAAPSRCHLYSLCLQRIMLVEFEYLAHQASPAGGSAM